MPVASLGRSQMVTYARMETAGTEGAADVNVDARFNVKNAEATYIQKLLFPAGQQQGIGAAGGWYSLGN
ncbi:MAG: hypothetical protein PWP34_1678 [Desulfuromonadales bacterium]|nr:hypothetical protein [Desulfuromonadales bacterium]